MAPPTPSREDVPLPPAPVSEGGTYAIETVSVGCKMYVRRPIGDGMFEERLAEILQVRENPKFSSSPTTRQGRSTRAAATSDETPNPADRYQFFIHWDQWNKRLDELVDGSRLVLSRDMEWPRPKPPIVKKGSGTATPKAPPVTSRATSLLKKATLGNFVAQHNAASSSQAPQTPQAHSPMSGTTQTSPGSPTGQKRKAPHESDEEEDAEGEVDLTASPADPQRAPVVFSKEQEIEKLRTSGSMTQSAGEIARVKNLNRLQIGRHEVEAWYFSPYPVEYAHLPILYICEYCLSFYPSSLMLARHRNRCTLTHPPGNEIYRWEDISFFEIDGKRQVTWCRNLSLISKCFLDHKTLYYDVQPFLYYVMTIQDDHGCHIIGYFSKEKESAENYNVACILTLPQHQRHGYGKLLIEFSYELSKKENKLGSPEKPLSDLGLLGYKAYWAETIVQVLLEEGVDEMSVDDIAQKTSITNNDVMWTCQQLHLFKHYKGQHVICLSDQITEQYLKAMKKRRRRIVPSALQWKPPVFSREQLRFGY